MIRVHVICEGQTEETFVNTMLLQSFALRGIGLLPSLLGKPGHKGGNLSYPRLKTDIRLRLLNEKGAWCTTFFDFYGLPEDFPGKAEARDQGSVAKKADCVTQSLRQRLLNDVGEEPVRRFIPYVQMHEFEALLFSDPTTLAAAVDWPGCSTGLQAARDDFSSPEEINDSPQTAPSKRISQVCRGYDKPVHGSLAAARIGLETIRRECRLFDGWLRCLEALTGEAQTCE